MDMLTLSLVFFLASPVSGPCFLATTLLVLLSCCLGPETAQEGRLPVSGPRPAEAQKRPRTAQKGRFGPVSGRPEAQKRPERASSWARETAQNKGSRGPETAQKGRLGQFLGPGWPKAKKGPRTPQNGRFGPISGPKAQKRLGPVSGPRLARARGPERPGPCFPGPVPPFRGPFTALSVVLVLPFSRLTSYLSYHLSLGFRSWW